MARHSRRVFRLSAGLGGSPSNFEEVRLKRMTDEELKAELIAEAVRLGFDREIAATDQDAALSWVEEQTIGWFDALSPEEQNELAAQYGDPREGPRLWPTRNAA